MNTPTRFRKRPVIVEAWHLTPDNVEQVAVWCGGRVIREPKASDPTDVYVALDIPTLEGTMRARTANGGDWVLRGTRGEFYPCKPGPFADTYEPEEAQP